MADNEEEKSPRFLARFYKSLKRYSPDLPLAGVLNKITKINCCREKNKLRGSFKSLWQRLSFLRGTHLRCEVRLKSPRPILSFPPQRKTEVYTTVS